MAGELSLGLLFFNTSFLIYIYIYQYIYMYLCVCVCVCVSDLGYAFYARTFILLWYTISSFLSYSGNINQNNTQVTAKTIFV